MVIELCKQQDKNTALGTLGKHAYTHVAQDKGQNALYNSTVSWLAIIKEYNSTLNVGMVHGVSNS